MIFNMLSLILPKILTQKYGQDAPYGIIISLCPLFIVLFLFLTSPCTMYLDPYSQIIIGAFFLTLSPISMLFGVTYVHILMFLLFLSLGEALASPKLYEFMFYFTKKGREGMFLALTSAPYYLTMGVSGYLSGLLLKETYPTEVPDQSEEEVMKHRSTDLIWITMMLASGSSFIGFLVFRDCFKN